MSMYHLARACQTRAVSRRRVAISILKIACPVTKPFRHTYSTTSSDKPDHRLIHIDDRLHNQRYHIVHLLGHSSFSNVWLAHDSLTSNYVAVKVCAADSASTSAANREFEILSSLKLAATKTENVGKSMVQTLLDRFTISSPNGDHVCLVSDPTRGSLLKAIGPTGYWHQSAEHVGVFWFLSFGNKYRNFPLNVARSLAAQLALAVSFIHSQGIVHGDLRTNNALVQLHPSSPDNINDLSIPELYAKYGNPLPLPRNANGHQSTDPPHGIPAIDLSIPAGKLTLSDARLVLGDFRSSFNQADITKPVYQSHAPTALHPPDLFYRPYPPLSPASDIWTLGASIFEILGSDALIDNLDDAEFYLPGDDHDKLREKLGRELTDEEYDAAQEELQQNGLKGLDADSNIVIPDDWHCAYRSTARLGWQPWEVQGG